MDGGRQAGKAGLASRAQAPDLAAEDVDPHPERHGGHSPLVPAGPEVLAGVRVPVEEAFVELDNTVSYDMIPAAGNSRYDTGFHLIRYAYTERCRSLSAGAKIEFIRNDYERDVQVRKGF